MWGLSTLSFAAPWVLAGLVALPVIWWLLRLTPPAPRRERFPALMLLLGLKPADETPAKTPLWLLILRTAIAALLLIGLAGPTLNARPVPPGSGELALVIDTGWSAAPNWGAIEAAALTAIEAAGRDDRTVVLVRTASATPQAFEPTSAQRAKAAVQAIEPVSFPPDLPALFAAWRKSLEGRDAPAEILYLSDGIAHVGAASFLAGLEAIAPTRLLAPGDDELPAALLPARSEAEAMSLEVVRVGAASSAGGRLAAIGARGRVLTRQDFAFEGDALSATVGFKLPIEVRNEIERIELEGARHAGAVSLIDERLKRRSVGLVSGGAIETAQPLLSDLFYVERALEPYANIRKASIAELVEAGVDILVLADVGRIVGEDLAAATRFVEAGGLLVRFAGARLAAQADDLVPVTLRAGGRAIGGALSWNTPQSLQPFEAGTVFAGLVIPQDVAVSRQVLAEPTPELSSRTWARLADGTPLVTAARRGEGTVVLFHVTANPDWSNLPISGLFVTMLERLLPLARAGAPLAGEAPGEQMLSPRRILDGAGRLVDAPGTARPIALAAIATQRPSAQHPPGLYGPAEGARALNTLRPGDSLAPLRAVAGGKAEVYAGEAVRPLGAPLLIAALALAFIDAVAALFLLGRLRWPRLAPAGLAALMLGGAFAGGDRAWADDRFLVESSGATRLAYIVTGNEAVDRMSRAGLEGLSRRLAAKTALEPGQPIGLDIESAELALFPLIYWPMTDAQAALSPGAQSRLDRYLKTGGMILFDTRDEDRDAGTLGATEEQAALRRLLEGLDVPPLMPLAVGHVLTRSFYILDQFPGRFAGGTVWVEALIDPEADEATGSVNDGVSSIVIGANDYAAAWAVDASGAPIAATLPGGERQREWAYRFGINLAMYALTGNYKGDEVHTRALIERLGE